MQIRRGGVEDSYRMLIPVRRHGDVNLPGPHVHASGIRLQYGTVWDGLPLPATPLAEARSRFPFRLPLLACCRNGRSAGWGNTLVVVCFGLTHAEYTPAPSN